MFDVDLSSAIAEIKRLKARIVALQVPEGLKKRAYQFAEDIENKAGAETIVVAEPCFGACDVPSSLFDLVDAIVNIGHSPIPSLRFPVPVIFVPARSKVPVTDTLKKAVGMIQEPVGVLAISQHLEQLDDVIEGLESMGIKTKIGEGDNRISHIGEILGCNYSAAISVSKEVNSYLLIASGTFHALGVHLATGKKVVVLDPNMEEELRKLLRWKKKDAMLIMMDKFDPDKLRSLGFDAYVSTACPRIAVDDMAMYDKPLLTPQELEIVLGVRKWENYAFDQMTEDEV
ncbi:MAG: diphthamide synthesis protein [Thermoplasmata archaeon]|nr:diphthamide synthesis protein [Thermoplasmata archaeon]